MTKIPLSTRLRNTTIRATTDIFYKPNRQQQIFPAAALRICDHHLHSSGIIPRIYEDFNDEAARIYEHEWFCVSQAVRCYSHSNSVSENNLSGPSHPSNLLQRVVSGSDPFYCDIWVDSDSIGRSSIQFGGLVSIGDDILATVRRVFVRMSLTDSNAGDSTKKLKSASFTEEEKKRFRESYGFDALQITKNYKASDAKKIQDLVAIKRPDLGSENLKTKMKELELPSFHSSPHGEESYLTRVMVGPQHVNFGNHADHAFLAETAFHALTVSDQNSGSYLSVQYISEVHLGDILESYFYPKEEGGVESNSIILVAIRKDTSERNVVLIAQAE